MFGFKLGKVKPALCQFPDVPEQITPARIGRIKREIFHPVRRLGEHGIAAALRLAPKQFRLDRKGPCSRERFRQSRQVWLQCGVEHKVENEGNEGRAERRHHRLARLAQDGREHGKYDCQQIPRAMAREEQPGQSAHEQSRKARGGDQQDNRREEPRIDKHGAGIERLQTETDEPGKHEQVRSDVEYAEQQNPGAGIHGAGKDRQRPVASQLVRQR